MTLQFVPPPDWLIQEYANRKSPVQEGLDSLTTAANLYRQTKQQQQTKQNEALGAYVKAFEAGGPAFAEEIAKRIGLQNPPSLPGKTAVQTGGGTAGIVPSPSQETPMDSEGNPIAPQQGPQLPGVREGMAPDLPNGQQRRPASGMGASSPIIDHWNQTMGASGQQQPSQPQAGLPNLPGGENPLDLLKLGKYGSGRLGALESAQRLADIQTARTDKNKPVPTMTKEDALAAGSVDPNAKIIDTPDRAAKDQRREDQMALAVTNYGKQIETNPIIKALELQSVGLHSVEEMSHLVRQGNTVAASAMGMKMARAMGEVGVVTENDVKRYVQSGKLTQAAADVLSRWLTGTPSNATLAEINQITEALSDSYDGKIQPIYNRYVDRFARAYKTTPEDAAYRLAIPYKTGSGGSGGNVAPEVGGSYMGGRVTKVTEIHQ